MSGSGRSADPIVIIGAGAAGIMAALFAAGVGRRVILLERTKDGGRKILISGGGRCNVLPSRVDASQYVTESSPNTLRKILLSWPLAEQRRFFEGALGIRLVLESTTGKLFPASNRAREVRDMLLESARMRGVELRFECWVTDVRAPARGDPWQVVLETGETLAASAVILATGGLSVPATGSDGTGLRIAERLGHTIHETYPALTPLTSSPPRHAHLAGISLEVTLVAPVGKRRTVTSGGFLFTHRGYSGPAVLDISHLAVRSRPGAAKRQPIFVQWTERGEAAWDQALREGGSGGVSTQLRRQLPARLADTLVAEAGVDPDRPLGELRREERTRLVELLARYPLPWTGDEGYKKAEVTGGGVSLAEIDPATLESRLHPRLFLCGEILDAFGPIGGYNFLWGWATGRAAGLGALHLQISGR
jgi:predicted Rossmann fold flavoprotein